LRALPGRAGPPPRLAAGGPHRAAQGLAAVVVRAQRRRRPGRPRRAARRVRFVARSRDRPPVRPRARGLAADPRGGPPAPGGRARARPRFRLPPPGRHRGRAGDRRLLDPRILGRQAPPPRRHPRREPRRRRPRVARRPCRAPARESAPVQAPPVATRSAATAGGVPKLLNPAAGAWVGVGGVRSSTLPRGGPTADSAWRTAGLRAAARKRGRAPLRTRRRRRAAAPP